MLAPACRQYANSHLQWACKQVVRMDKASVFWSMAKETGILSQL